MGFPSHLDPRRLGSVVGSVIGRVAGSVLNAVRYALNLNGTDQSVTPVVFEPKSAVWGFSGECRRTTASTSDIMASGDTWKLEIIQESHATKPNQVRLVYVSADDGSDKYLTFFNAGSIPAGEFVKFYFAVNQAVGTAYINVGGVDHTVVLDHGIEGPINLTAIGENLSSIGGAGNFHGSVHVDKIWDETGLQGGDFTKGDSIDFYANAGDIPWEAGDSYSFDLSYVAVGTQTLVAGGEAHTTVNGNGTLAIGTQAKAFVDGVEVVNGVSPVLVDGRDYHIEVDIESGAGAIGRFYASNAGTNFTPSSIANFKHIRRNKPVSFGPEVLPVTAESIEVSGGDPIATTVVSGRVVTTYTDASYQRIGKRLSGVDSVEVGKYYECRIVGSALHKATAYVQSHNSGGRVSKSFAVGGEIDEVLVWEAPESGVGLLMVIENSAQPDQILEMDYELTNAREITEFEYREYLTKGSVEGQVDGSAIGKQTGHVPRFGDELYLSSELVTGSDGTLENTAGSFSVSGDTAAAGTRVFSNFTTRVGGIYAVKYKDDKSQTGGVFVRDGFNGSGTIIANSSFDGEGIVFQATSETTTILWDGGNGQNDLSFSQISIKETTDLYFPNFDAGTNLVELPYIDSHYDFSQKGAGEYGEIIPNKIGSDGPELWPHGDIIDSADSGFLGGTISVQGGKRFRVRYRSKVNQGTYKIHSFASGTVAHSPKINVSHDGLLLEHLIDVGGTASEVLGFVVQAAGTDVEISEISIKETRAAIVNNPDSEMWAEV
ncbi:MAG: hypothetical protein ACRBBW_03785 [Cellvibrionaceae bacterium]